jgi:hypothetical protein
MTTYITDGIYLQLLDGDLALHTSDGVNLAKWQPVSGRLICFGTGILEKSLGDGIYCKDTHLWQGRNAVARGGTFIHRDKLHDSPY